MSEIWENPFANAYLKIERANKHIADIEQRLRTSSNANGPSLNIDAKTGEQFFYYGLTDSTLRSDIALTVGDAIHNLKCALDIAYREAVRVLIPAGFDSSRTKFPVGNNRKHLESSLTKTAKINADSPLFILLVERVKSYKGEGGDRDICAIHSLDIDDKHHLLIPMLAVVGFDGAEVEFENGSITRFTVMLIRPNFYRTAIPLNGKIKNYGEARFEITFSEGTPLDGLEVIPTLKRFSAKTLKIVRVLQRIVR